MLNSPILTTSVVSISVLSLGLSAGSLAIAASVNDRASTLEGHLLTSSGDGVSLVKNPTLPYVIKSVKSLGSAIGITDATDTVGWDIPDGGIQNIKLATASSALNNNYIVTRDTSGGFSASQIRLVNNDGALQVSSTTDTQPTLEIVSSNGGLLWGSGSSTWDTRLSRSAANTLLLDGPLATNANIKISGYAIIGSTSDPLNTTAGDLTATRLCLGTDTAFSTSNGEFLIVNGSDTTTTGATPAIGSVLNATFTPTTTQTGALTGTKITSTMSGNNAVTTGGMMGLSAMTVLTGAGDAVNIVGGQFSTVLSGNAASNQGLLTVTVGSSGGLGYIVNDILTVVGTGTGGTVIVNTIDGGGAVTSVTIDHPGSGYTVSTDNATTGGTGTGALITILTRGSTTVTSCFGLKAQAIDASGTFVTPTVTAATAINVINSNVGSGPITISAQNGIDISSLSASATLNTGIVIRAFTGTSTNANIGMDIKSFTGAAANNVGIRIATPSGATTLNRCLQFVTQSTTAPGGILFGSGADSPFNVNLYRTGNGRLRTDGEFQAVHFLCVSGLPTVAGGPAQGIGAAPTVTANSTDAGLQITFGVSAGTANATLFTVTYAVAYTNAAQFITYSPTNAAAAALTQTQTPFVSATSATTFTFRSNAVAMANGTYSYNFNVRGT